MSGGTMATRWYERKRDWAEVEGQVIAEAIITLFVNGIELATIMSTPSQQDLLALGFLKGEGLIEGMEEVEDVHISQQGCCVEVWLNRPFTKPDKLILTSGCGGGVTFRDPTMKIQPLDDNFQITTGALAEQFTHLHPPDSLYSRSRGVHAAGLSDGDRMLAVTEDVGRHNAVDKLIGACMVNHIDTQGRILLATGRVSSEMMLKAGLMGCPIVASRNSPTSMSVGMAEDWNITLIGYVRRQSMRIYTHPYRLLSVDSAR